jgi:Family of unknown function (DUF6518)
MCDERGSPTIGDMITATTVSRRPVQSASLVKAAMIVVVGLAVGTLTSFGQTYLSGPLDGLVNSASAWLVAPFIVGSLAGSRRNAAAGAMTVCLLQLAGYTATAQLRSFPSGDSIVLFWSACAIVAGPVFGLAGHLWRTGPDALRGLGAATLAAAFIAEGAWTYLHILHNDGAGLLWLLIGAGIALFMARGVIERRWLLLTVPVAFIAEFALTNVIAASL